MSKNETIKKEKIEQEPSESIAEVIKETAKETAKETHKDSDFGAKLDNISADLKSVIDKIESFEVDTDEVLENVSRETKDDEKSNKGALIIALIVLILGVFALKDKIKDAIPQRQNH